MKISFSVCTYVTGKKRRDTKKKRIGKQDGRNTRKSKNAIVG